MPNGVVKRRLSRGKPASLDAPPGQHALSRFRATPPRVDRAPWDPPESAPPYRAMQVAPILVRHRARTGSFGMEKAIPGTAGSIAFRPNSSLEMIVSGVVAQEGLCRMSIVGAVHGRPGVRSWARARGFRA